MHYHIILTERCNLKCKYCYEKSMELEEFDNGLEDKWDYDMQTPVDSEVSIDRLKKLLKDDDTLIFYGGEPLVMMDKIKEIMDNFNCRFMMQTNGILLRQLPTEYLLRMDKILVSIDGTKSRTDHNRGLGKYSIVRKSLVDARERGFKGEFVARMTLAFPDIYDQVMHLVDMINEGLFDSVHWQIDAGFYKNDFDFEKFSKFVEEYNSQIDLLLDFWVSEMGRNKKVWKFYPFLGIYDSLKTGVPSGLPCGSGHSNFTINTSGQLSACPIINSVKNLYCGSVDNGVEKKIEIQDEECKTCEVYDQCGGRCLYWREAKLWAKEGDKLICDTIKHLINGIKSRMGQIEELITEGKVSASDFEFEKYFGPEIIP